MKPLVRDIEAGPLVARFDAGREEIRVEVRFVAGKPFVDLRRFGRGEGRAYPTPRGLLVPAGLVPDLVASLVHAFSLSRPPEPLEVTDEPSVDPNLDRAGTGRRAPRRSLSEPSPDTTPSGLTDRQKEN
jgi:hypothetical protein